MERFEQSAESAMRPRALIHSTKTDIMRFSATLLDYFPLVLVEQRLQLWIRAGQGPQFRMPRRWYLDAGEFVIDFPSLPSGYRPISEIHQPDFHPEFIANVIKGICDALDVLHQSGFHMGFLLPDAIHVHRESGEVILDVQPYPSAIPLVNHINAPRDDVTEVVLSRYSRAYRMPRVADHFAVGLFIQWLTTGRIPKPAEMVVDSIPQSLRSLCERLFAHPEAFLFASQIGQETARALDIQDVPGRFAHETDAKWLHPMDVQMPLDVQAALRDFLARKSKERILGLVGEDRRTRAHILRQHFHEVLEHYWFLNVSCQSLPFATLKETVDWILYVIREHYPDAIPKFRSYEEQFRRLLRRHYEGTDVFQSLADWLGVLYRELVPVFEQYRLCLTFEDAEAFDEESQHVFLRFWKQQRKQMADVRVIFTGQSMPKVLRLGKWHSVQPDGVHRAHMYRELLLSQLGAADAHAIDAIVDVCLQQDVCTSELPLVAVSLIERGWLTVEGTQWSLRQDLNLDSFSFSADEVVARQLRHLNDSELSWLRVIACLPSPMQPKNLLFANHLDYADYAPLFVKLHDLGLLWFYHDNSMVMPEHVLRGVQKGLRTEQIQHAYREALRLQHAYRPGALPQLEELAQNAGELRVQYAILIWYFRQVRSVLSYGTRLKLLNSIRHLQQKLNREAFLCWDRHASNVYARLNDFVPAEQLAKSLYQRTGEPRDRFVWLQLVMFLQGLEALPSQAELLNYVLNDNIELPNRVRAASLLLWTNFYESLTPGAVDMLIRFYREKIQATPTRLTISVFAEFAIMYAIMLFQHVPDKENEAAATLEMLEAMLSGSPHHDLMGNVYDAYIFHSNIGVCRQFVQMSLRTSRRLGCTTKEQIAHLNGMEMALYQGDLSSFQYHKDHVLLVDHIRRKDLLEQFLTHQLIYAVEWEQWADFDDVIRQLRDLDLTAFTSHQLILMETYAAFRRGAPLPQGWMSSDHDQFTLFADGLRRVRADQCAAACERFEQTISKHGYHWTSGLAHREMLELLIAAGDPQANHWLQNFKEYLKKYAFDVFWPDYYRLAAAWFVHRGDKQNAILHMRRAINGYQLIGKAEWVVKLRDRIAEIERPDYLTEGAEILNHPLVGYLARDRAQFLNESLDLHIVMELSQLVTEAIELSAVCERLTAALFEYFPVTHAVISFNLANRQEKRLYASSGFAEFDAMSRIQGWKGRVRQRYVLYQQGSQRIGLELYLQHRDDRKQRLIDHLLSFIRPHVANAVHYMEMMTDNLTGFFQRRYFYDRLAEEIESSTQYGLDLSLLMLDLDNFRSVNEFGHPEGDRVLREVSALIRELLRRRDVPGRYGGEEFLLVLPKTDGFAALRLAHRLRREIETHFSTGRPYTLTASVGVASLKYCQADTPDELISLADNAEITAKTTGKNKVVAAWV